MSVAKNGDPCFHVSDPHASTPNACGEVVGRFAPSPTGKLHAGNIFAYLIAWLTAKLQGGKIVLRIEDIDAERSKQSYADILMKDLEALGLIWDVGPIYQSNRLDLYQEAFSKLEELGLTYPCFCSRADLLASSAPHRGERAIYAGTCKALCASEIEKLKEGGKRPSFRLEVPDEVYGFHDLIQQDFSQNLRYECGDFILVRSDGQFAYQLAVVVDDADLGITSIVRGSDLLDSTPQQMYLQNLLSYPDAVYAHVPLFVSDDGRRLSKRNRDAALDEMLGVYRSPKRVLGHIAFLAGIIDADDAITPDELLKYTDLKTLCQVLGQKGCIRFR